ncbi:MAG: hypothetical protein MJE77_40780 [Proteobacteria bacterium]|nr:hypothetical protein [Pseudomonadota bacterium]
MGKLLLVAAFACLACNQDSVEEYNKKLDDRSAHKRSESKAVKVETAVPGGTKIACETLLDAAQLGDFLGEKAAVTVVDQTKPGLDATSVCSVRRGGKKLTAKQQEKLAEKTLKLGVLPGDELCNISAYCSIPADEKSLASKCRADGLQSNEAIGVFACVRVRPKGPDDSYTYKFVDPDSRCILQVRGGPSVNEEKTVRKCARAALYLISRESLL